jgi:hypothetical protein
MVKYIFKKQHLGKLTSLIEKYNKKSIKLKQAPLIFHVEVLEKNDREYISVSFEGDPAKINGWEFIGTLQHSEGGNILRGVPSRPEIPESFRYVTPHCEHCAKKRHRKDTFVLKKDVENPHSDLEQLSVYKQVGRNCLRDFLGHDPSVSLALLDLVREDMESDRQRFKMIVSPLEAVYYAAAIANQIGWSKENARSVFAHIFPSNDFLKQVKEGKLVRASVDEKAISLAHEAIDFVKNSQDNSSFIGNIKTALDMRFVTEKEVTIVAWAVGVYLKHKEDSRILSFNKETKEIKETSFVGAVGEKIEQEVVLVSKRRFVADYGVCFVYKFEDKEGNILSWMTSVELFTETGAIKKIKATVKKHSMFKNQKETQVTRVKYVE